MWSWASYFNLVFMLMRSKQNNFPSLSFRNLTILILQLPQNIILGQEDKMCKKLLKEIQIAIDVFENSLKIKEYISMHVCMLSHFSCVHLFVTLWPVACQDLLSVTRILEWVSMPSSRGSSWPRDWSHISYVSCIGRHVLYH